MFFHFPSFSFMFFHFLSFSIIFSINFLSFSFIFFHFRLNHGFHGTLHLRFSIRSSSLGECSALNLHGVPFALVVLTATLNWWRICINSPGFIPIVRRVGLADCDHVPHQPEVHGNHSAIGQRRICGIPGSSWTVRAGRNRVWNVEGVCPPSRRGTVGGGEVLGNGWGRLVQRLTFLLHIQDAWGLAAWGRHGFFLSLRDCRWVGAPLCSVSYPPWGPRCWFTVQPYTSFLCFATPMSARLLNNLPSQMLLRHKFLMTTGWLHALRQCCIRFGGGPCPHHGIRGRLLDSLSLLVSTRHQDLFSQDWPHALVMCCGPSERGTWTPGRIRGSRALLVMEWKSFTVFLQDAFAVVFVLNVC